MFRQNPLTVWTKELTKAFPDLSVPFDADFRVAIKINLSVP